MWSDSPVEIHNHFISDKDTDLRSFIVPIDEKLLKFIEDMFEPRLDVSFDSVVISYSAFHQK